MKSLETVQKIFKVLNILARIGMIVSFVICAISLLGCICAVLWYFHGTSIDVAVWTNLPNMPNMIGILLSSAVFFLTNGILFYHADQYFKMEQEEGTPFSENGAIGIRNLGIKTLYMPLIAIIISAVIYGCFDIRQMQYDDYGTCVVMGIGMILISFVFRYGAELEKR